MKFRYSTTRVAQRPSDSLPRAEVTLTANGQTLNVLGLVDSGSTINILPYQIGLSLGMTWEPKNATIGLTGSLSRQKAIPVSAMGQVGSYAAVQLIFAWIDTDDVPVIFGQTNFFVEFEVHLYRAQYEFEIVPRAQ